jgi:hypothetical protein
MEFEELVEAAKGEYAVDHFAMFTDEGNEGVKNTLTPKLALLRERAEEGFVATDDKIHALLMDVTAAVAHSGVGMEVFDTAVSDTALMVAAGRGAELA